MNFGLFSLARESCSFVNAGRRFTLAAVLGLWLVAPDCGRISIALRIWGNCPGGENHSVARDINDSGQVVGESQAATGTRAFRWTSGGGMQDLGDLPGGNDFSRGYGINTGGQIVGDSSVITGFRAFSLD